MNSNKIAPFVDDIWDKSIVPQLVDYIRIPKKSPAFDSKWHPQQNVTNVAKTACRILLSFCRF